MRGLNCTTERRCFTTFWLCVTCMYGCMQGPDVGELDRVKVRSSGSGLGAAWHLQQVDVMSSATGNSYHFPFNNWCVLSDGPCSDAHIQQAYVVCVHNGCVSV